MTGSGNDPEDFGPQRFRQVSEGLLPWARGTRKDDPELTCFLQRELGDGTDLMRNSRAGPRNDALQARWISNYQQARWISNYEYVALTKHGNPRGAATRILKV
jgi:hypothetical protein